LLGLWRLLTGRRLLLLVLTLRRLVRLALLLLLLLSLLLRLPLRLLLSLLLRLRRRGGLLLSGRQPAEGKRQRQAARTATRHCAPRQDYREFHLFLLDPGLAETLLRPSHLKSWMTCLDLGMLG
jgi:hypothetical protein